MDNKVNTIIFDFGSVLVEGEQGIEKIKETNIPEKYHKEIVDLYFNNFFEESDTASIEDAKKVLHGMLRDELKQYTEEIFNCLSHCVRPLDYAEPLLKSLKDKGYKLYYLSNWARYSFEMCKKHGVFDFIKYFNGGIVSYEVGFEKPYEGIYNYLIEKYKLNPAECVFVDDKKENLEAAKKCGLNGILFKDPSYASKLMNLESIKENSSILDQLTEIEDLLHEAVDENRYKYYYIDDEYLADDEATIHPVKGIIKFYPSVKNAIMAFDNVNKGRELFVHVPVEGQKIKASKSKDPSAEVTEEIWFKEPTKVKCIGKIRIGNQLKTYPYNGGELKSWAYSWLTSQDSNVVNDTEADEEDKQYKEGEKDTLETDSVQQEVYFMEDEFNIPVEKALQELDSSLNTHDKLILFNEDAKNDPVLKRYLFKQRLRNRKQILALYDQVKNDHEFIRYAFPEIKKYQKRNLFIDTYYYLNLFFENNTWVLRKGLNLFLDFMTRLLKQNEIKEAGYVKNTIMIPVKYWDKNHDGTVWNYRVSLNPIALIYFFLFSGNMAQLKSVFGDRDIWFVGTNNYFKLNFSELDAKDSKKYAAKFKTFLIKICMNEQFDPEDIDTTGEFHEEPEVIRAKIVDKIEDARGVDITPQVAKAVKKNVVGTDITSKTVSRPDIGDTVSSKAVRNTEVKIKKEEEKELDNKTISKLTLNQPDSKKDDAEAKKQDLANKIEDISKQVSDIDSALNQMDDTEIKSLILSLKPEEDAVDMSAGRALRMSELDKKFMETNIKGRTIRDILDDTSNKKEVKTDLKVATPNDDWKNLTFMNFDKHYNLDKDILACFHHLEGVSSPIAIRNIEVKDNSTSEDRVELYTVQMEDYRGKQFTVKLDIPIMVDNRFLLRGNNKSIQTQFFNMPIIKTEEGTCQIISNYMKIFVRRFREGNGRSLPDVSRFLKAVKKYKGSEYKITFGDNRKICSKYQLPIDYIDLASEISKIDHKDFTVYFDQDEIRKLYQVDDSIGIPFLYDKVSKKICYYKTDDTVSEFINFMLGTICNITGKDFWRDAMNDQSPSSSCTFSRASIMNSQIPLVVICAYHIGLRATMDRANIKYELVKSKTKELKDFGYDFIQFEDGYVAYKVTYSSSLLMNGLKDTNTKLYKLADIDDKNTYLEILDNYGGRIKADGLDNFYDLMVDPMTEESLKFYHMPTNYIDILLYANNLLADNKFIKHTDTSSRRIRRYQLIAVYTYKVLADAYAAYSYQLKHTASVAKFMVKQSAVVDRFLTDSITSDDSVINALRDIETTNSITTKGPSGMNSDRAYSLDKRTYDDSMLNVVALSTGFAGNVGITRQATMNANVTPEGYVKSINGDTDKMNSSNTLSATEALTPFGSTHDDPFRTAMTFVQTSKHQVRTVKSDPLLVTSGADEAMPYMSSDRFAFKAKAKGKIVELNENYMMVEYLDGKKDYINLTKTTEKNSDGGYYVGLKLDPVDKLKVGSIVEENQILAYDKQSYSNSMGETDNLAYNIGTLAKVAIINSDETFEDSGIISKKLADELATPVIQKHDMILDKGSIVHSLVKIGDHIEAGQPLMIWQTPFEDDDANALIKSLTDKGDVSELGKRKLKADVTGTVVDIKIFRTVEVEELSDSLKKIVNNYEKPLKELAKKLEDNKLDKSQVPAHYVLPAVGKLKKAQDSILIEIYVEYLDSVGIGDKIVYYSANKAVEKSIFPEGLEPYCDYRPNEKVQAVLGETSLAKRMVVSITQIGALNTTMIELNRKVRDILGIKYDDSIIY